MPKGSDGGFVSMQDALNAWEPIAIALLAETAKKYNGFVTYTELSDAVQTRSGIRHNGLLPNWIGDLLQRVIYHCRDNGIPHLSSLCVTADGTVGNGYSNVPILLGDVESMNLEQLDDHAARTRLECYRYFGAELPPGGGEPMLTPKAKAAQEWKRAQAKMAEPPKLCPECFIALPVTGVCDECA
ncbi:hypothetical protein M2272_005761 [Mycobacterium frederiksbergense]|uniref:Uncharacterized protein n=1 Tax=Mycolicibacterium frederiksbergense TaxID=117567 RepID=A0ABT6L811_9MYCO|nr:hypothetical protein [Mycolicibacterium frederiksbergense]MDH6199094.1 hypothetical protein [Mycolicibacterium frederiksbergense]